MDNNYQVVTELPLHSIRSHAAETASVWIINLDKINKQFFSFLLLTDEQTNRHMVETTTSFEKKLR